MGSAVIGLLSAVLVAVITQAATSAREKRHRKEQKEDKAADKHDDVMEAIKDIKTELSELGERVDRTEAKHARARILRFDGEILRGETATKDSWRTIIEDIDSYQAYCAAHQDFRNGVAIHAIAHLQKTYDSCLESNNFLS